MHCRHFGTRRDYCSDELGLEPSRSLQQLERAILIHDAVARRRPEAAHRRQRRSQSARSRASPSFGIGDAQILLRRERLVDDLVARLAEGTLVGVIGPSGIGKSSLLRAGLLRALASGALPGSEHWPIVVVRPGAHPAQSSKPLRSDLPGSRTTAMSSPSISSRSCSPSAATKTERAAFVDALMAIADDPRRRASSRLHCAPTSTVGARPTPRSPRSFPAATFSSGPCSRASWRGRSPFPPSVRGWRSSRVSSRLLVGDVAGEPGGLPLLSTTLLELWRRRDGSTLRLADYQAAGGVRGAVGRLAEAHLRRPERRRQGRSREP